MMKIKSLFAIALTLAVSSPLLSVTEKQTPKASPIETLQAVLNHIPAAQLTDLEQKFGSKENAETAILVAILTQLEYLQNNQKELMVWQKNAAQWGKRNFWMGSFPTGLAIYGSATLAIVGAIVITIILLKSDDHSLNIGRSHFGRSSSSRYTPSLPSTI